MYLIAHRGNLHGPILERENRLDYIQEALDSNYDVEIDIRYCNNKLMLGHDDPQQEVGVEFLCKYVDKLWIHCKNREALEFFSEQIVKFNYFWHQNDDYVITSIGYIFTLPGKPLGSMSIAVLPEGLYSSEELVHCAGICSDYIGNYKSPCEY